MKPFGIKRSKSKTVFCPVLGALLVALSVPASVPPVFALGPWKAQIVDAESKQPLSNVVVLAVWTKVLLGPGRSVSLLYFDSVELTADPEGRFTVAKRNESTFDAQVLAEPEFFFFKPGYGQWRFQGEENWQKLAGAEKQHRYAEAGRLFSSTGVMIELPPLKTRQERAKFYYERIQPEVVPAERKTRWLEVDETERAFLGL